jgi:hypothetical protein
VSCKTLNSNKLACNDSNYINLNVCSNLSSETVILNSNIDNVSPCQVDNVDNANIPILVNTHNVTQSSIVNDKLSFNVKESDSLSCLCYNNDTTCKGCNFLIGGFHFHDFCHDFPTT